ncbi:UDP-N-acetylglucosamine 2-epimerase [Streptomyces roseifaciens]
MAVVLGTRPEIVKLSCVVGALGSQARLFHVGQHDDGALFEGTWHEYGLPEPELVLRSDSLPKALQISEIFSALHHAFKERPPHTVVVHGDTNAALAGATAAYTCGIRLFHVEAGLRNHDCSMLKEHNQAPAGQLVDALCAPKPPAWSVSPLWASPGTVSA